MSRKWTVVTGLAVSLALCATGHAQNSAQNSGQTSTQSSAQASAQSSSSGSTSGSTGSTTQASSQNSAQNSPADSKQSTQSSAQNAAPKPQSLGDLARQLKKDKSASSSSSSSAKVFTNDDLGGGSATGGSNSVGSALKFSVPSNPQSLAQSGSADSPEAGLAKAEAVLNALDAMDRPTLVKGVLQGYDVSFPNRRTWEEKLWNAKLVYVQQGKQLIARSKDIMAEAQRLRDQQAATGQKLNEQDPQVQAFALQMHQFVEAGTRADAVFQSVVMEGQDMAKAATGTPAAAPQQ